ncbi:MAG: 3-phosphoshikimate 1-carboxyvinyltransferase [Erysipelotrichaceae bacterium]|nr:3-phosphoshikimate 1-carboxyvinyltransferase [Erysipelotrichaceae bacterium]
MRALIQPSACTQHFTQIPPSKSLAHRAVICAALAGGTSRIDNIDYSMDVMATLSAMEALGAHIERFKDHVIITGIKTLKSEKELHINCEESGSTLRFLIPLFSLCENKVVFTGKGRLMQRPQSVYEKLFEDNKTPLRKTENELIVEGVLQAGEIHVRGDVSSQFISGLLFALPLLSEDSKVIIEGPYESESYVNLTIEMLKKFGIQIEAKDRTLTIFGNQSYHPQNITVESDYSQLAFFAALGVLNGPVRCGGLKQDSLQGDRVVVHIIEQMNGKVTYENDCYCFDRSELAATVIDLADCPDLGPALMMLASFAQGETKIINAGRLRIKESDRIEAMESELRKCGVQIRSTDDTIWITGKTDWSVSERLSGHNDHRIVMALAVGATVAKTPVVIEGAEAVRKSYPAFFEDLARLGIDVHVE